MELILYCVAAVSGLILSASLIALYVKRSSATKVADVEVPAEDNRQVVRICFGTQTGTAEKFSKQLATKLDERYGDGTKLEVVDMENYDHEACLEGEKLIFFLTATYGDGEPTDNSVKFYEWLEKMSDEVMNGDRPEVKVRATDCFCGA